jgi:hypothetical protein
MATGTLPPGWRMERLGLIAAVEFRGPSGTALLWCDGEWFTTRGQHSLPAPGVPIARNRQQAERVGAEFIRASEASP